MRSSRQSKILEVIQDYRIDTQEELVRLLNESGFNVTQATVSRDIKELGLIKVMTEGGTYKYSTINTVDYKISSKLINVLRETVISLTPANNLVCIRTIDGSGITVSVIISQLGIPEIVGKVEGNDTVLLVAKNDNDCFAIIEKLENVLK